MARMKIDGDACIECGLCEYECPWGAIEMNASSYISVGDSPFMVNGVNVSINYIACVDDFSCMEVCPTGAIYKLETVPPGTGDGGGSTYDPRYFTIVARQLIYKYSASKLKTNMEAIGLTAGIKTLNASAIRSLVTSLGGEISAETHTLLKGGSFLTKVVAVGTVLEGLDTIVAFSDGEITNEDWAKLGKLALSGLSFVPGPIGLVATGINVGIAVYESQK
jgi:ferredoxin